MLSSDIEDVGAIYHFLNQTIVLQNIETSKFVEVLGLLEHAIIYSQESELAHESFASARTYMEQEKIVFKIDIQPTLALLKSQFPNKSVAVQEITKMFELLE